MRLFIAINFEEDVKDQLCGIMRRLKPGLIQGNLTRRENLHLTLAFIGETTRVASVRSAMNAISAKAFTLSMSGFGRFKRSGGDIYWIGVTACGELETLYGQLFKNLTKAGFQLEDRPFRPHLTLGRQMVPEPGFDADAFAKSVPELIQQVSSISLMKSQRIQGKLVYTEVYRKSLSAGASE
ncbi:RNA 2',3'-cyclic phosphodiesterase [Candidatus Soleaferrea massiliensis]|uniref:RNA 2',3'-cyclic phosphodiesterase n=1 Tax=Candidatus Soleaferrea massiliensis TaxID=1470354 RepID=UPI0005908D8C|nr:RNA 2',3'-cyclic phosphodiesterase [Candidatus Soleaferrea massiliensis]